LSGHKSYHPTIYLTCPFGSIALVIFTHTEKHFVAMAWLFACHVLEVVQRRNAVFSKANIINVNSAMNSKSLLFVVLLTNSIHATSAVSASCQAVCSAATPDRKAPVQACSQLGVQRCANGFTYSEYIYKHWRERKARQ